MRILVIGGSSYVGKKLIEALSRAYKDVYGTYCSSNKAYEKDPLMFRYELGDDHTLIQILNGLNPDIIISSIRGAFPLQLQAHQIMAEFIKKDKNKRMIFISTSNVFDGVLEKVHAESDLPKAKSDYGIFKINCERLLSDKLGENNIILRIPEVWGKDCPRVLELTHNIKLQKPVQAYENIYMNYVTNEQIAKWVLYIIKNDLRGIFHVGSSDLDEYIHFRERVRVRLGLLKPNYVVERFETRSYQAVLPSRKEIPDFLQIKTDDIIEEVAKAKR